MQNIFKFAVTGERRKSLVAAMSEVLNAPIKYLGAPGFQYRVGEYEISKTGVVTGAYDLNLFVGLSERGFEPEVSPIPEEELVQAEPKKEPIQFTTPRGIFTVEKVYTTAAEAETNGYGIYFTHEAHDIYIKPNPDGITEHSKLFALVGELLSEPDTNESNKLCVEVPNDFTDLQIDNLSAMIAAKEPLLKKVLDAEHLPIQVTDNKIAFNWFTLSDPADAAYYVQFIYALCETAKEKKRVIAKNPGEFENPKFAMRVWLVGLGLSGREYKKCRALMMRGLSGDSAWRYSKPEKPEITEEGEMKGDE